MRTGLQGFFLEDRHLSPRCESMLVHDSSSLLFSSFPPSFLHPSLPALPNILSHSTGARYGLHLSGESLEKDAAVAVYISFPFFLASPPAQKEKISWARERWCSMYTTITSQMKIANEYKILSVYSEPPPT